MYQRRLQIVLAAGVAALSMLAPSAALAAKPTAKTGSASAVTSGSATISGTINPQSVPTQYYFQYGTTVAYGSQTAVLSAGSGAANVPVSAALTGLGAATKYHFRLVATDASYVALGADASFTTTTIPLSLSLAALPNPVTYGSAVTLAGTLSGTGNSGREVELLSDPFPYTPVSPTQPSFQQVGNTELTSASGAFSFPLLAAPLLATEYRAVALTTPQVQSPLVTLDVALGVTTAVRRTHARHGFVAHFSGVVTPTQDGARVGVEHLGANGWQAVSGTLEHGAHYSLGVHLKVGGSFRVIVLPLDSGPLSAGYSREVLVHALR